ncbi:MAG: glycosyltransferase family 2 protein [Planctomycetes bacterium]|nr:glycosyltransferase family 2 protein [Planctomycetota bacterium]
MNLSVVIPVYNSEQSLPLLLERLNAVLPGLADTFEVILINDGSKDGSWEEIEQLSKVYPWIRGFDLMRNYGQHNAILYGIRAARFETIVTMDDDLQNPPEEIEQLLQKYSEGYDVVYGTPAHEKHSFFRYLASRITKLVLQSAMGAETATKISAFRVFRTQLRDAFESYQSSHVNIDVLLTWGSTRFAAIPVRQDERAFDKSNYTLRMLIGHATNMMTGFSILPLQLASMIGFSFSIFGLFLLLYVFSRYLLYGTPVAGFPFLASSIAIFSGVQLFALGIIGEYLARVHFRTMNRPAYTVRKVLGGKRGDGQ